jgi:Tectonin domain
MKNQSAKLFAIILALVLGTACTQFAPAQTFKKVKVAGSAPIVQVASGGASVWALASNGNPYIFNGQTFVLANTISLSQIAAGGGNAAQKDTVWALNSSGSIYHAHKSGTSWVFTQVPGVLDLIAVGPGYQDNCHPYEVWGLNTASQIYRYNFCGNNFDQESGFLCDIHVGGGDVWGAECGPRVYRFTFSGGNFEQISDPFGAFPALTVGPNGAVWAIDTSSSLVYQYDYFVGFVNSGWTFTQIQAGGDGIWALGSTGNTFRWDWSALGFTQVPGTLASISVGSGGGVWGTNSSHQVFAFSTP